MKTIGIASHYIRQHPGIQSVVASFEEGGGMRRLYEVCARRQRDTLTFHWTRPLYAESERYHVTTLNDSK